MTPSLANRKSEIQRLRHESKRPAPQSQVDFALPSQRVFVYGSLLRGLANHWLLDTGLFLGATKSVASEGGFAVHDLGPFPGAVRQRANNSTLKGEMYLVTADKLQQLDQLEEHPDVYRRELIETEMGYGWTYLYRGDCVSRPTVHQCDWRSHLARRGDVMKSSYSHRDSSTIVTVTSQRQRFQDNLVAEAA